MNKIKMIIYQRLRKYQFFHKSRLKSLYHLTESEMAELTYGEWLTYFEALIVHCSRTSQKYGRIKSKTSQHYHASVLFTHMCVKSRSLLALLPSRNQTRFMDNWDFPSVAAVTRAIVEARLTFYYLAIEKIPRDEWEVRWNVLNLHDCERRIRLFTNSDNIEEANAFKEVKLELQDRLNNNSHFLKMRDAMSEKQANAMLTGRDAYLESFGVIAEKCGIEKKKFDWIYMLLSNQVHVLPMSYYRTGEGDRGRGIESECEEGYIMMCISMVVHMMFSANAEMETLFSK